MEQITKLLSGRINRKQFIKRFFLYLIIVEILGSISWKLAIEDSLDVLLSVIVYIIFLLVNVVKRFHDFNKSGKYAIYCWLMLNVIAFFNPFIALIAITIFHLILAVIPGDKDANIYGDPPRVSNVKWFFHRFSWTKT